MTGRQQGAGGAREVERSDLMYGDDGALTNSVLLIFAPNRSTSIG